VDSRSGLGAGTPAKTALLVEGVAEWRDSTSEMLERHGFHVLVAQDGGSALRLSRGFEGVLDLVLTDVVMPDMQGTELADAVGLDRPGVVVIYKTAYARRTLAELGLRPTVLLEKPFDEAQLLEALARSLPPEPSGGERRAG